LRKFPADLGSLHVTCSSKTNYLPTCGVPNSKADYTLIRQLAQHCESLKISNISFEQFQLMNIDSEAKWELIKFEKRIGLVAL
jgi:hypothetical protein